MSNLQGPPTKKLPSSKIERDHDIKMTINYRAHTVYERIPKEYQYKNFNLAK